MIIQAWIVIILGVLVGLMGQIAYLIIVDHEKVRSSKSNIKDLQNKIKSTPQNDPKFKELQAQLIRENANIMRQTMKPTYATFIPFLIIFILVEMYLSYVPITIGVPFNSQVSGNFSGVINSSCFIVNNKLYQNISIKNGMTFNTELLNNNCIVSFVSSGKVSNLNLSGVVGSSQPKDFKVDNISLTLIPNPVVIATMPFNIPIIGNQLNWFWTYLLVSLITGLIVNRILLHFKLIA